jgi:superfamily II DNA or RNA helicase
MLLQHSDGFIFIVPDDESESRNIMNILNENGLFTNNNAGFRTGRWFVKDRFLPVLNKILIPLKDKIRKDVSMVEYIELFKNQGQANGKDVIKIIYGPNKCKIIGPRRSVPEEALQKKMKYFFQGAVNCKSYKEQRWDGYILLYNKQTRTFPSGLLERAVSVLKTKEIPYTIEQTFEYPKRQFDWVVNDGITPDPDQVVAVEAALKNKRGIVKAPTGFGKTAILAKRLTAGFGVPTLFVANKKALLDDAAEEFLSGIDGLNAVGQIKDGVFDQQKTKEEPRITSPVIVATIQSLNARLEDERTAPILKYWLNNVCKFVMVDECQAVGTKMWDDVLDECHAPYRILLSATPWRTDGATLKLEAQAGPSLFTTTAEEQIEKGRLCELDIYYHKFDHQMFNDGDHGIPYPEAYAAFIAGNQERNKMIVRLALELVEEERLTLVFVTNIDHGHILKQEFIEAGLSPDDVRFIWGGSKNKDRREGIQDFKKGKFKVLIGSTIFDAGVNIPAISGAVVAGAGNADITIIQKIGRAARNCNYEEVLGYTPKFLREGGKKCSVIHDIADTNICYFRKQARNRYYTLRKEYGKDRVHLDNMKVGELSAPKKDSETSVNNLTFSVDGTGKSLDEFLKGFESLKS